MSDEKDLKEEILEEESSNLDTNLNTGKSLNEVIEKNAKKDIPVEENTPKKKSFLEI